MEAATSDPSAQSEPVSVWVNGKFVPVNTTSGVRPAREETHIKSWSLPETKSALRQLMKMCPELFDEIVVR